MASHEELQGEAAYTMRAALTGSLDVEDRGSSCGVAPMRVCARSATMRGDEARVSRRSGRPHGAARTVFMTSDMACRSMCCAKFWTVCTWREHCMLGNNQVHEC